MHKKKAFVHSLNYEHALELLLPHVLRKPRTLAWLKALLSPLGTINHAWKKAHHEVRACYAQRQVVLVMEGYLRELYPGAGLAVRNTGQGEVSVYLTKALDSAAVRDRVMGIIGKKAAPFTTVLFVVEAD